MRTRILIDILLLFGIFMAPFWLTFLGALICLFVFENFYEIIIMGIIFDSLYGIPIRFISLPAIYTLSASILFIARAFLKKHLKFYM